MELVLCEQKGWDKGGGSVHLKGANSMAMSVLSSGKTLVGTGRVISVLFGVNGLRIEL